MRHVLRGRAFFIALAAVLGLVAGASAQTVTTGAISGQVSDESGGVLPGASVTAVHEPTGSTYTATTDGDGRFSVLNVRAGGPYTVTVSLSGFKEQKQSDITAALGSTRELGFRLHLESMTENVEVVAQAGTVINPLSNG